MDYQPPELCVMSVTEAEEPGKFLLDLASIYDTSNQVPLLVDEATLTFVMEEPYQVPMCPPGWPNVPVGEVAQ